MIWLLKTDKVVAATEKITNDVLNGKTSSLERLWDHFYGWGVETGKNILIALAIFVIGRFLIQVLCKVFAKMLQRRNVDPSIQSFMNSFVSITLMVLLIISVISALGINTTSFAALLASAGVAVGMALSGNLQNFAGGLIVLLLKPYRIGDYIEAQGKEGFVKSIQIFHTVLRTWGGKLIYVPNGAMSSGNIVNWRNLDGTIRVQWIIGIDYGEDTKKARRVLMQLFEQHPLLLKEPAPSVNLDELAASSVNLVVRVWTKVENYWPVYYGLQEQIYEAFNKEGINFPYPQIQVHTSGEVEVKN